MRGMVLFTIVAFSAAVAFGSVVMANEKSAPMQGSKLEMGGGMKVDEAQRDAFAFSSLLSAGYVVVNSYATCSTGRNGFITFDMFGIPVESPDGVFLGSLRNLLLNEKDYDDAFAVINIGGSDEYGKSSRLIPVPMTALEISETESGKLDIVLNSTEAELEAAPLFDATKIDNPQYEIHVYEYYGIQPFWTEECAIHGKISR